MWEAAPGYHSVVPGERYNGQYPVHGAQKTGMVESFHRSTVWLVEDELYVSRSLPVYTS